MAKEYFSHDYYARKDLKCVALIKDFGAAGYGVYWSLVEIIYEQGGRIEKFPALFTGLSHELGVSEKVLMKQIEAMVHKYHLILEDEKYIWSASILQRLQIREAKRSKKSESGKQGGIKSGESRRTKQVRSKTKHVLHNVEANEAKEIKGKERKDKANTESNGAPDLSKSNLFRKPNVPTLEKVQETFYRKGGTPEMAEKFFNTHSATDWYYNGSPITNFANLVPGYIATWNKRTGSGPENHYEKNLSEARKNFKPTPQ